MRATGSFNIMIMTLRNSVSGYQHFEGLHSLHPHWHKINRQTHTHSPTWKKLSLTRLHMTFFLNSISSEKTADEITGLKTRKLQFVNGEN